MKIEKMQASEIISDSCGQGLILGITRDQLAEKVKALELVSNKQASELIRVHKKLTEIVTFYENSWTPAKLKRELNALEKQMHLFFLEFKRES